MSSASTVVLLGAGLGARLRPLTDDRPKAVVEIAGEPLAVRMLRQFAERGVSQALVVVGHFAERAKQIIGPRIVGKNGETLEVRFVENAAYASTNTMYSLLLGMPALAAGGFVVEGDIVASEAVIDRLISASRGAAALRSHWAVDAWTPAHTGSRLTDDGAGRIVAQEIWRGATTGPTPHMWKSAGMLSLSASGAAHLTKALQHEADHDNRRIYYDDVIGKYLQPAATAADTGEPELRRPFAIDVLDLKGAPWIEIDDLHDMAQARAMFEAPAPGAPEEPTR
jgi:choline kinase